MAKRLGRSTFRMDDPPSALGFAAAGGKKEGEGPLGEFTFEGVPFTDAEKTGTETGDGVAAGDAADGAAAVVPAEPTAPAEPAESAHGETADGTEGENAGQSEA